MESRRTCTLISPVRPAAAAFRPEMESSRACTAGRQRMTNATWPTPPSRPTSLCRIGGARKVCDACNADNKRGTQDQSLQHIDFLQSIPLAGERMKPQANSTRHPPDFGGFQASIVPLTGLGNGKSPSPLIRGDTAATRGDTAAHRRVGWRAVIYRHDGVFTRVVSAVGALPRSTVARGRSRLMPTHKAGTAQTAQPAP